MKPSDESRINAVLAPYMNNGEEFAPADIAKQLDVTSKQVSACLKLYDNAVRVSRAHVKRSIQDPVYVPAVWKFEV